MPDDKPLHVHVAEALGWTDCRYKAGGVLLPDNLVLGKRWVGWPPGEVPIVGKPRPCSPVTDYDTSWEATGPLIEKYRIDLVEGLSSAPGHDWRAEWPEIYADGPTPLIATCRLIIALKEAGKLDA